MTVRGGIFGRMGCGHGTVLLALVASPLLAQSSSALLDLSVVDAKKAPLTGVVVTLTNKETGYSRKAATDASGRVRVAALSPGTYRFHLELAGYTGATGGDLVLLVGQTKQVNATMVPVQAAEVAVVGAAPVVDTLKTDASTNVTPEQIEGLPVLDRQFERLAFITPGVQRERGAFRFIGGGPVLGAGGNASQSTIMVDGAAIANRTQPDFYVKPNDTIVVGTNFWATPAAVVRNGFRFTYGFGFLADRNFGNDIWGIPPGSNGFSN